MSGSVVGERFVNMKTCSTTHWGCHRSRPEKLVSQYLVTVVTLYQFVFTFVLLQVKTLECDITDDYRTLYVLT